MNVGARSREEILFRKMIPWLNRQLGDEFQWLGKPDDCLYESACSEARGAVKPLDGEMRGKRLSIALEHTTVDSFSDQRRISGAFRELARAVRETGQRVPRGNRVDVSITQGSAGAGATRRDAAAALPELRRRLDAYYQTIPADPARRDAIRGRLLEEPRTWKIGQIEFRVRRSWWPNRRHARFSVNVDVNSGELDQSLDSCVRAALTTRAQNKSDTYQRYRRARWKTLFLLEVTDFQLSSADILGESFRRVASEFDLRVLDYIAIADDNVDAEVECCWAYKGGEIRTAEQQYTECLESYEL